MPIELRQRRKEELMKIYWYLGFPFYSSTILRCPLIILFLLFLTITYPPTCTIFLSTHPHPQKKSFYFLPYFQVPASKWFPPKTHTTEKWDFGKAIHKKEEVMETSKKLREKQMKWRSKPEQMQWRQEGHLCKPELHWGWSSPQWSNSSSQS